MRREYVMRGQRVEVEELEDVVAVKLDADSSEARDASFARRCGERLGVVPSADCE